MPYKSLRQERWAHTKSGTEALGGPSAVAEWDRASKGKKLPSRAKSGGAISSAVNVARMYGKKYADGGLTQTASYPEQPEGYPYIQAQAGPPPAALPQPPPYQFPSEIPPVPEQPEAQPSRYPLEPMLSEQQMGEQRVPDQIPREYLGINDANQWVDMRTNTPIDMPPETRRPGVLPLAIDPEGNTQLAMPKIADLASYIMSPLAAPAVPTKAGEMVLGAGAAKTAPEAASVATKSEGLLDTSNFKKIGFQKGSNPGGTYVDPQGTEWYIKQSQSGSHALNEKLAAELYKLAGVPVPEVRLTLLNGKPAIASKIIQGHRLDELLEGDSTAGFHLPSLSQNFPADAWLANHDVVGTGFDNIVVDDHGIAHRIDLGGSLLYRAQGKPKENFGYTVPELESMKDPSKNEYASQVFGQSGPKDEVETAQRIANIDPQKISDLVDRYGPPGGEKKRELFYTLLHRREQIKEHYAVGPEPQGTTSEELEQLLAQQQQDAAFGSSQPPAPYEESNLYKTLPESEAKPIPSIMGINKTHDAGQVVQSLSKLASFPGNVTGKQINNIENILNKLGADKVAAAMVQHKINPQKINPWLSPSMKENVSEVLMGKQAEEHFAKAHKWEIEPEIWKGTKYEAFSPKHYAENLKPLIWKDYKPANFKQEVPLTFAKKTPEELRKLGFNPDVPLLKGGHHSVGEYPHELEDPETKPAERAWFGTHSQHVAYQYGKVGGPYVARAPKAFEVDWPVLSGDNHYSGQVMHELIETAKHKGADLVVVHGISDLGGTQTQYAFLNTKGLRAPHANFDVNKLHLAIPHLGLVGGGLLVYGTRGNPQEPGKMQRGGPLKRAGGGFNPIESLALRGSAYNLRHEGMIHSSVPGRTDKLNMNVPAGSYVIPADIPSALGQGNSQAGGQILSKMFSSGPYGIPLPRGGGGVRHPRLRLKAGGEAESGEEDNQHIPIVAAGGEFLVHPEVVRALGAGDIGKGHKILDRFVIHTRKKHIKTLRKLPGPKK